MVLIVGDVLHALLLADLQMALLHVVDLAHWPKQTAAVALAAGDLHTTPL